MDERIDQDPQPSNVKMNEPQKRSWRHTGVLTYLSLALAIALVFWAVTPSVFGSPLAQETPTPTEEATAEATEQATAEGTVEATEEATTEATPEETEEVTEEDTPAPEATETATLEATETVTAEVTVEVTETVTVAATIEVTEPVTAEATVEVTETVTSEVEATPEEAEEAAPVGDIAGADCAEIASHAELTDALVEVVSAADSGGFSLDMWATIVNRDGEVCAVAFSGENRGDQWPGSRVISAQKANTANAFSLPGLALSTANLYASVQPGGSLFGLQESNPVDTAAAYGGDATAYGQEDDPMVGSRIGGVNVFGGGLALYSADGSIVGGIGVSGDTSCTDHIVAWKVRDALGLDYVPAGVSLTGDDNVVYDQTSGWSHVECGLGEIEISDALVTDYPIGAE